MELCSFNQTHKVNSNVFNFSKMSKFLLLADSNVANNLQHQATIGKGQFDFKKCTTKGLFIDKILAAQSDLVVVAGIDCIVNEALSSPRESERSVSFVLHNFVTKIIDKLEDEDSTTSMIALASPLYWNEFSEEVKRALSTTFKQIRRDWKHRIKFIPPCPGMAYLPDNIHLNELAGVRYTNHIIKKACSLAKIAPNPATNPSWADDVELQQMEDEEMEQDDSQPNPEVIRTASTNTVPQPTLPMLHPQQFSQQFSQFIPPPSRQQSMLTQSFPQLVSLPLQGPSNGELLQKLDELTKRVDSMEDKSFYDNLTFAAIREDQDDAANRNHLDKATLTGVKIKDFHKLAENEKPAAMKEAVNSIIALVTAEADKDNRTVVFTRHRNRHIRNAPTVVIEARFQDAKQATAFRKDFSIVHKRLKADGQLPEELTGVSAFPVQTLATRVRATLLKSMARVVDNATGPHISAYCQQYNTRPMLKIVTKGQGDNSSYQSYGFVEAIMKLRSNEDLHRVSLNDSYQIAGSKFRGRLQQEFVLLKDN